jgi:hypothetical protein
MSTSAVLAEPLLQQAVSPLSRSTYYTRTWTSLSDSPRPFHDASGGVAVHFA